MGFNKRYITVDKITNYLEKNIPLKNLFNADAYILMDGVSSQVLEWHQNKITDSDIKIKLNIKNG